MTTNKIARISMLLAISVVLGLVESYIPIFNVIPGVKLGLANIVIVYAIYKYSFKDALYISILRVFLVGLLRSGLFSITFFFSLSGALLSLIFMYLFKKYTKLSVIGVSIIGAISHSIGQIIIAVIFLSNINIIYYFPILLLSSIITGIIVGMLSKKIIEYA
ncbi:MAG TPA: Gx transporter family protein [Bacilli bacterium]|nr:Gx transporter family protein [Bacilli bacterium]